MVQPVINLFLYDYLYKTMYEKKYSDLKNNRTGNMTKILGASTGFA